MRILFIATVFRCGEKVYPILRPLSERHQVSVVLADQMAPAAPWYGDRDPRPDFYKAHRDLCAPWPKKMRGYDLIITDDNVAKRGRGGWRAAGASGSVPLVGCPHGNYEFRRYLALNQVPTIFDYSFVFGEKERAALETKASRGRFLAGGIPANDILAGYERSNEYILVVVGYVAAYNDRKRPKGGYLPFTEQTFLDAGILQLQEKYGLPVVVKEKSRYKKKLGYSLKGLEKYNGVTVVMDVEDDNKLIAGAVCLVSAPSTLCFKAIQMGIPTALLLDYGMTGNFDDFPGLVSCDSQSVVDTIARQESTGRDVAWLRNNLSGAESFRATELYLEQFDRFKSW